MYRKINVYGVNRATKQTEYLYSTNMQKSLKAARNGLEGNIIDVAGKGKIDLSKYKSFVSHYEN